jgi:hypothetical protein
VFLAAQSTVCVANHRAVFSSAVFFCEHCFRTQSCEALTQTFQAKFIDAVVPESRPLFGEFLWTCWDGFSCVSNTLWLCNYDRNLLQSDMYNRTCHLTVDLPIQWPRGLERSCTGPRVWVPLRAWTFVRGPCMLCCPV